MSVTGTTLHRRISSPVYGHLVSLSDDIGLFEHADGDVPPIMYSGDLLFAGSIGRTDLPGGDTDAMMRSLAQVVLPQPEEMIVLPGHGATTTIARERATNPYLTALAEQIATPPTPRRGM